jgi:tRNA(Ile)-lysidine synthetase-like protein
MRAREGMLLRPLLGIRRATLRRYATARDLTWWEDPANADLHHLRSWLRHVALPLLGDRLPDLPARLEQGRRQAAHDRRAWDAALRSWPGLSFTRAQGGWSVEWAVLRQLPATLAKSLAQALARGAGGPAGPVRIARALASLASAQSGASADLGRGWRFELAFGRLTVLAPLRPPPVAGSTPGEAARLLDAPVGQTSWGSWRVRWTMEPAPAIQPRDGHTAWFIPAALSLRAWRPGDRLAPLGGIGQRLAVRCFQEARVPRSFRLQWPMIEGAGELAWIPGVCRSDRFVPRAGEVAVRIDVDPPR